MLIVESLLALRLPILVPAIFAILVFSSELGFWVGHWAARLYYQDKPREEAIPLDENVSTITNASLGLLALFLGFTLFFGDDSLRAESPGGRHRGGGD